MRTREVNSFVRMNTPPQGEIEPVKERRSKAQKAVGPKDGKQSRGDTGKKKRRDVFAVTRGKAGRFESCWEKKKRTGVALEKPGYAEPSRGALQKKGAIRPAKKETSRYRGSQAKEG